MALSTRRKASDTHEVELQSTPLHMTGCQTPWPSVKAAGEASFLWS